MKTKKWKAIIGDISEMKKDTYYRVYFSKKHSEVFVCTRSLNQDVKLKSWDKPETLEWSLDWKTTSRYRIEELDSDTYPEYYV